MIQESLKKHLSILIKQIQLGRITIFPNRQISPRTESEPHVGGTLHTRPPTWYFQLTI